MHILICNKSPVPVFAYGGTERVVWDLAKCLVEKGHQVSLLVPKGSHCPFAHVIELDDATPLQSQIPQVTHDSILRHDKGDADGYSWIGTGEI